jgi:hypothetical protein
VTPIPFGIGEDDSKLRRRQRGNLAAEVALGPALLCHGNIGRAALNDLCCFRTG